MYCSKCGKEVHDDAEICVHCGCRLKNPPASNQIDAFRLTRCLLTVFLGFIGSWIINNTYLKACGWKSRTCAYFFLGIVTFGIYPVVAGICNLTFDPNQDTNIGYFKEN